MSKCMKKVNRRMSRRRGSMRRYKTMRGGWQKLNPADLNDMSMSGPSTASHLQGGEYKALHVGQHGGGDLVGAPAFESQTLPSNMMDAARVGGTMRAFEEIRGMQDGGRRRKRHGSRKHGGLRKRHGSRKHGGSRKRHGSRKQGGGANMSPGDNNASSMLLTGRQAAVAEGGMNPDWVTAKNPSAFNPIA